MAENSNISWTDHSWSPWHGCAHAADSPGCLHCYAEAMSKRNPKTLGVWGPDGTRVLSANWGKPEKWQSQAAKEGKRLKVFPSICDPFEDYQGQMLNHKGERLWMFEGQPLAGNLSGLEPYTMADARRELFRLIDATPNLDWLLLTKRPENIWRMWEPTAAKPLPDRPVGLHESPHPQYRPNVYLGTSVSTQADADRNIPELRKCRKLCPVLFASAEPLLEPIDLRQAHLTRLPNWPAPTRVDWVIIGGESGLDRRPVPLAAITGLVDQCRAADVRCFVKQDAALKPGLQVRIPDQYWAVKEFPEGVTI